MPSKQAPTHQKAADSPTAAQGTTSPPTAVRRPAPSNQALVKLFRLARSSVSLPENLSVSSPDDPAEREAERVAAEIMRMPDDAIPVKTAVPAPIVQRKCAAC